MPDSTRRNLIIVLRRILRQPFSISVISVSVLFATLHHGPASAFVLAGAIIGMIAYATSKLHNENFIRESIREHLEHKRKQDMTSRMFRIEELDLDSRIKMKSIVKLQGEVSEDTINFPVVNEALGLSDTIDLTESLVERALMLAQKHRELQRYLSRTKISEIEHRIQELGKRVNIDSVKNAEIEKALASKKQELEDYRAIQKSANMILDQLDSIECSFSGLRTRLMRIKSTDISQWATAQNELIGELGELSSAVDVVEQSINEALSISTSD